MTRLLALAIAVCLLPTGCTKGSDTRRAATASRSATATGSCPDVVTRARAVVDKASARNAAWDGPTTGPRALTPRTIAVVAQSMQNPGVAAVAHGIGEAAAAIGWTVTTVDGQGTPAGIQNAFDQALAVRPAGIVIAGFDPATTSAQVSRATAAHIPLVGWQALPAPGPGGPLFTNVTTRVEDVARLAADAVIAGSNGTAGVVILTDSSIPFAEGKSRLIETELRTCSSVTVLSYDNIPLADVTTRMPAETSALLSSLGRRWTHSVAINDVYFENAAAAFRQAGRTAATAPVNIGAGDGDAAALGRIRAGDFQAATVPSPLRSEGWQLVDELNRAFAGRKASGYVPQLHLATRAATTGTSWDPDGFEKAYRTIWGR